MNSATNLFYLLILLNNVKVARLSKFILTNEEMNSFEV